MMPNNRKTYIFLSFVILAITLYQISLQTSPKKTIHSNAKNFSDYKINNKPLKEEKQGSIDSH